MSSQYQNKGISCNDYLVLNPKDTSLFDLVRLLFSEHTTKDFLHRPEESAASDDLLNRLTYRWVVFVSISLQKILLLLKNPVADFGSWLRVFLNLVSINGGLLKLFLNKIRGNVVRPEEAWDGSRSVAGSGDIRDDLDERIIGDGDEDERYFVHLSLMASKLSYEDSDFVQHVVSNLWKMEFLHFYNFWNASLGNLSTQAFVFQTSASDPNLLVVAFRGTEPFDFIDWCTDIDISWFGIEGVGKLHGGFIKALGLSQNMVRPNKTGPNEVNGPSAYYTLRQLLQEKARENKTTQFIIAGHSLGGALAILFTGLLIIDEENEVLKRIKGVYTFGQPRVGDGQFGQYMNVKLKFHNVAYRRFVYCNDAVPRLPYDGGLSFFKHFGECLFYDSLYKGKVLNEEPNKNYFSLIWLVPKYLNSYWELIRGQTVLPAIKGRLYGEGFGVVLLRLIGLFVPGLSAHGPQDYDNVTRLGNVLPMKDTIKFD